MSKPVERMKSLMCNLPKKDTSLGYKFLENRDFDQLKELVDSAIYKIKKNLRSDNPKEEYLNINMTELSKLKSEVDTYTVQLNISYNEEENIKDEDNYEIEEDINYDEIII